MSFRHVPPAGAGPLLARMLRPHRPTPEVARARIAPDRVSRVLAVKLHDQLGDFLVATPAIRALRRRYPGARLALVTREFLEPLASRDRDIDLVWTLPRADGPGSIARFVQVLAAIAAFQPDLAVVLNSVSRSRTADAIASLSRAAVVVGRSRVGDGAVETNAPLDPSPVASRDGVYDADVAVARTSAHQADRLLDLARYCDADAAPDLVLAPTTLERLAGRERLEEAWRAAGAGDAPGPGARVRWIGIHPGAANPLKCWPLERFVELGAALAAGSGTGRPAPEASRRIVVFDAPREAGRAAAVHAGLVARGVRAGFVPSGSIADFAAACAALDLLVCNDSGVMHVASALRVASVSFHALGNPAEWGPRHARAVTFFAPGAIETLAVAPAIGAAERLLAGREGDYIPCATRMPANAASTPTTTEPAV